MQGVGDHKHLSEAVSSLHSGRSLQGAEPCQVIPGTAPREQGEHFDFFLIFSLKF